MAYTYINTMGVAYYLHRGRVTLVGSTQERPTYYFRREPDEHAIDVVPEGYEVFEGARSALPLLRKKALEPQ